MNLLPGFCRLCICMVESGVVGGRPRRVAEQRWPYSFGGALESTLEASRRVRSGRGLDKVRGGRRRKRAGLASAPQSRRFRGRFRRSWFSLGQIGQEGEQEGVFGQFAGSWNLFFAVRPKRRLKRRGRLNSRVLQQKQVAWPGDCGSTAPYYFFTCIYLVGGLQTELVICACNWGGGLK